MNKKDMTYEELIRDKEYHDIAILLVNDKTCRNNNAKCIKKYFKTYHGVTLDQAIERHDLPSIFTVERKIRQLKKVNSKLCGKNAEQDDFKQIALDIPIVVEVF